MEDRIFKWKRNPNVGPHSFTYLGEKKRVLANDVVVCPYSFIKPFVHQYECLAEIGQEGEEQEVTEIEPTPPVNDFVLEVVSRGRGYYDVINPNNPEKPVNEKALRKTAAYELAGLEVPEKVKRVRRKKSE